MKKKTSAKEEKKSDEEIIAEHQEWVRRLSHSGEAAIQLLTKWEETNNFLERIAKAEEERNEIAKEEYSDSDDEDD